MSEDKRDFTDTERDTTTVEVSAFMNLNSSYTDIAGYKQGAEIGCIVI